ncbi:phage/plasmid primase, P4 family [uncultured Trichococcus sp.]|uniref:DNA primase family protein n=1 Tax=uncultured Trichococcus sp. TaxID=189665 RepID=UPI002A18D433|nr:phage/plasmid primase, P4 family [uncultured Trichococcus sp.]
MIRLKNRKNTQFIKQYLNDGLTLDSFNAAYDNLDSYKEMMAEFNKIPTQKRLSVIQKVAKGYILPAVIESISHDDFVHENAGESAYSLETFKRLLDEFMLEVNRLNFGIYQRENGALATNKKVFAASVMKLYSLLINKKDYDSLLVYNHRFGYWEQATIAVNRLIIELIHYLGSEDIDFWSINLEKSIVDTILRKTTLYDPHQFNSNFMPFANVTLNTITAEVVLHSKEHLATIHSNISYDAVAECPIFENFLTEVFDDEQTIMFVQEWFGYVLSGTHKSNALVIGSGKGANGKSTLFDVLSQLVGLQNVSSAPLSNFNNDFGIEPLIGMKLNLATESDADSFKTGKIKALTAGEPISINRKNKQEVTLVLPTKLVFLVNELPMLNDTSMGFERRLLILPFLQTFTSDKQDKNLPKKLSSEISGILNWAIIGLKRLIEQNYQFTVSESMKRAKEQYLGVANPVERFVDETIVAKPANVIDNSVLLDNYNIWLASNFISPKGTNSPQVFWRAFDEATRKANIAYLRGKSNGKGVVRDIGFRKL